MNTTCSAASPVAPPEGLRLEWQRLALLGQCLHGSRNGKGPSSTQLEKLKEVAAKVSEQRTKSAIWSLEKGVPLSSLECDVLACSLGPEAEPSLGILFQSLQSGGNQPYPTIGLIQELLALNSSETQHLYLALAPNAPLRKGKWIEVDKINPYHPVRPAPRLSRSLLGRGCEADAPPGAYRVEQVPSWEELILATDKKNQLEEFLAWIRHRSTVFQDWGASGCGGPVALFSGPSGTGKTFAAAAVAGALGWPLYKVDLGRLVSKYIGDTEKNLNELFEFSHGREAILLFDEADSLFGKRGEVREARDRFANMEVSHLLARLESHDGPCILTSNIRDNIDSAFIRRFQVVVDFPRPDAGARRRLWDLHLPPRAPRSEELCTTALAEAVALTGGDIRNAALHGAMLAADQDAAIGMKHLVQAVYRELAKSGRIVNVSDLGPLKTYLAKGVQGC